MSVADPEKTWSFYFLLTKHGKTVVICGGCGRLVEPGVARWRVSDGRGSLCQHCRTGSETADPDLFEPDVFVDAKCSRDIAVRAFDQFASRVLLGFFDEQGRMQTRTYGQVMADARLCPKLSDKEVVVCGPTNYWHCVLSLACLLQDVVIISLESRELATQLFPTTRVFDSATFVPSQEGERWAASTATRYSIDTVCFLPTSGTTGAPKLARFSEELCLPSEGFVNTSPFVRADVVSFDPSFLPSLLQTMKFGGSRYLCTTDVTCLSQW